jgi:hypothetical protein
VQHHTNDARRELRQNVVRDYRESLDLAVMCEDDPDVSTESGEAALAAVPLHGLTSCATDHPSFPVPVR